MARLRSFVVPVIRPGLEIVSQLSSSNRYKCESTYHPIQCTINGTKVGTLLRVKVGCPKDRCTCSGANRAHIDSIASKARCEDLAVDVELRGRIGVGILGDLLAHFCPLVYVVPVEVKRDEGLHAVVGGRLKGEAQLLVSVRVNADVEGKRVDAERLGPLHVRIIVCWASTIGHDADLLSLVSLGQFDCQGSEDFKTGFQNTHHEVTENKPVGRLTLRKVIAWSGQDRGCNAEQNDCNVLE